MPKIVNWETTLLGLAGLLTATGAALTAQFDGDPATIVNWNGLLMAISLAFTAFGLFRARDANKSTEDQ
jgi:hypothetical protein